MPEYEVDVVPVRRIRWPLPKRPKWRFRPPFWLLVLAGLGIAALIFGAPNLKIMYEYRGSYNNPVYLSCDYFGIQGWRRFFPETVKNETCPLIKLMPLSRLPTLPLWNILRQ
jgi:hypothetical protein